MTALDSQRTPEELARLGAEILDRRVRPMLRPDDDGKFVAIDVGTGDFELDDDDYTAVARLRTRSPQAEIWLGRVGAPAAYRMGRCPDPWRRECPQ
jgi:hypothetical protein